MSKSIIDLTSQNFQKQVANGNWIIDFWAAWCGPCKILSPIVDEAAKEMKDVKFGKINVDMEQDIAQEFEVMSIPTLIFFKDGEVVNRTVGVIEKEEIKSIADESF